MNHSLSDTPHGHDREEPPRYGVRVPPAASGGPGTSSAGRGGSGSGGSVRSGAAAAASPEARSAASRAARRMGRGLSFTAILLGALVGLGLTAIGVAAGWLVGVVLVFAGILGYVLVQSRALPMFRDPLVPALRARSKLWLIPAALLLLGCAGIGAAFFVDPVLGDSVPADLLDDYALAFVVGGLTMVIGAGLGFGLVAMALFTRPDDDDSPLRPTDYAEHTRQRDRHPTRNYYDSDWIRHGPH